MSRTLLILTAVAGLFAGCGDAGSDRTPRKRRSTANRSKPPKKPAPAPAPAPKPEPAVELDVYVIPTPVPQARPDPDADPVFLLAKWNSTRRECRVSVGDVRSLALSTASLAKVRDELATFREDAGLQLTAWENPPYALLAALIGVGTESGIQPFKLAVPLGDLTAPVGDPDRLAALRSMPVPRVAGAKRLRARPADVCHLWVDSKAGGIVAEWPTGAPTAPDVDGLGEQLLAWGRKRLDPERKPWSRGVVVIHAEEQVNSLFVAALIGHVFQQGIGRVYLAARDTSTLGEGLDEVLRPATVHKDLGPLPTIPAEGQTVAVRGIPCPPLGGKRSFGEGQYGVEAHLMWDAADPDMRRIYFGAKVIGHHDDAGFAALAAAPADGWSKGKGIVLKADAGVPVATVVRALATLRAASPPALRLFDELKTAGPPPGRTANPVALELPQAAAPTQQIGIGRRLILSMTRGAGLFLTDPGASEAERVDAKTMFRRCEQWAVAFRQAGHPDGPTVVLRVDRERRWASVHIALKYLFQFRIANVVIEVAPE